MLFPVSRIGKWGFIDRQGNIAIPPQFDLVLDDLITGKSFSKGMAAVCVGKCAYVYPDGFNPDSDPWHKRFDGKWGYIDMKGRLVISPRFSSAKNFSRGRAAVATGDRWLDSSFGQPEKWGYCGVSVEWIGC